MYIDRRELLRLAGAGALGALATACGMPPPEPTPVPRIKPTSASQFEIIRGVSEPARPAPTPMIRAANEPRIEHPGVIPPPKAGGPLKENEPKPASASKSAEAPRKVASLVTKEGVRFGSRIMVVNYAEDTLVAVDVDKIEKIVAETTSRFGQQAIDAQPYVFSIHPNSSREGIDATSQGPESFRKFRQAEHTEKKLAERFPQAAASKSYHTVIIPLKDVHAQFQAHKSKYPQMPQEIAVAAYNTFLFESFFETLVVVVAEGSPQAEIQKWLGEKYEEYRKDSAIVFFGPVLVIRLAPPTTKN